MDDYEVKIEWNPGVNDYTVERLISSGRANAFHQKMAYREREYFRSDGEEDWEETDPSYYISCKDEVVLHRWAVNHALYSLTNYNSLIQKCIYLDYESCPTCSGPEYENRGEECEACEELYCQSSDAAEKYKDQVMIAALKGIAERWPVLAAECERQNPSNYND